MSVSGTVYRARSGSGFGPISMSGTGSLSGSGVGSSEVPIVVVIVTMLPEGHYEVVDGEEDEEGQYDHHHQHDAHAPGVAPHARS